MNFKILGVETSSSVFSVAVCRGQEILSFREEGDPAPATKASAGRGRPSTLLASRIEDCAKEAGIPLSELDGFAVSIGPGSFTGLRIGVTTVKTLAWALRKRVLPVSTLEVIAQGFSESKQPIHLLMDARKGKVYTASFRPDGKEGLKRLSPDRLMLPEEALKEYPKSAVWVGDAVKFSSKLLPPAPSARALCRMAARRWPNGVVDDPHRLVPEYLYSKESDIVGW
jgi:tRNA threonylcarbamoyladenosine biosynthesis protein TsaB